MDAIRKQANKLRDQVAKHQAVFKQFGHGIGNDAVITDEAELQRHQQLERLYISTRAGKHFQRDIVRGVEGLISAGSKQMEYSTKLADDCSKYGNDGPSSNTALARVSQFFGNSRNTIEKERDNLHRTLGVQVAEPLRAMVVGAPLEDARHLTQRYDRIRQEVENQSAEVVRRQSKSKEASATTDNALKLQAAESKLSDLISTMSALGKEATSAMMAVEAQQQRLTLQRLIAMVEAERSYHQYVAEVLDKLHAQMAAEQQRSETGQSVGKLTDVYMPPPSYEEVKANGSTHGGIGSAMQKVMYFLAEVIHPFDAEADGELSISIGDYVVVRQVTATGWSEGECKGKAGWFPSAYVEQREKAPLSKIEEATGA
uniref:SH3 domain-containing protein n=1 Tax=Araucaria cunninghamii TaxID=56994 RepID=A0A0D6QY75_ARACU